MKFVNYLHGNHQTAELRIRIITPWLQRNYKLSSVTVARRRVDMGSDHFFAWIYFYSNELKGYVDLSDLTKLGQNVRYLTIKECEGAFTNILICDIPVSNRTEEIFYCPNFEKASHTLLDHHLQNDIVRPVWMFTLTQRLVIQFSEAGHFCVLRFARLPKLMLPKQCYSPIPKFISFRVIYCFLPFSLKQRRWKTHLKV